jgi:hypothetical protein
MSLLTLIIVNGTLSVAVVAGLLWLLTKPILDERRAERQAPRPLTIPADELERAA